MNENHMISSSRVVLRLAFVSALLVIASGCCSVVYCDYEYASLSGDATVESVGACGSGCGPTTAEWQQIEPALGP